jgi:hypothetical protein
MLTLTYSTPLDTQDPGRDEHDLLFLMLDALLRETPFDQWEH